MPFYIVVEEGVIDGFRGLFDDEDLAQEEIEKFVKKTGIDNYTIYQIESNSVNRFIEKENKNG